MQHEHFRLPDISFIAPHDSTSEQRIEMWLALVNRALDMVRSRLRERVKSEEELDQAMREWYRKEMEIRDFERYGLLPPELSNGENGHRD